MPRRGDALSIERVEFMEAEAHLFPRGCDAEEFALVCAADLRADTDSAGLLDHIVEGDPDVGERLQDAADDGFDALGAGTLARSKRNVVPVRCKDLIHEVRVFVGKCAVKGLYRLALSAKTIGEVSVG